MPLKRLILILASVISAGVITVWLGSFVGGTLNITDNSALAAFPILLLGLVLWRLLATRSK